MVEQSAGFGSIVLAHLGGAKQLGSRTQTSFRIWLRALRRLIEQSVETPIEELAAILRWGHLRNLTRLGVSGGMAIFGDASEFSRRIDFPIPTGLCQQELTTVLQRTRD